MFSLNILKQCLTGNGDIYQSRSGSGSRRGKFLFVLPVSDKTYYNPSLIFEVKSNCYCFYKYFEKYTFAQPISESYLIIFNPAILL